MIGGKIILQSDCRNNKSGDTYRPTWSYVMPVTKMNYVMSEMFKRNVNGCLLPQQPKFEGWTWMIEAVTTSQVIIYFKCTIWQTHDWCNGSQCIIHKLKVQPTKKTSHWKWKKKSTCLISTHRCKLVISCVTKKSLFEKSFFGTMSYIGHRLTCIYETISIQNDINHRPCVYFLYINVIL